MPDPFTMAREAARWYVRALANKLLGSPDMPPEGSWPDTTPPEAQRGCTEPRVASMDPCDEGPPAFHTQLASIELADREDDCR